MQDPDRKALGEYLGRIFGCDTKVLALRELGRKEETDLKTYGYGRPLLIEIENYKGRQSVVLETMSANSFGHDHPSDRAQILLWSHAAFNHLPKHVRSLDVGAFMDSGDMISLGKAREFFLLTEYVSGVEYSRDLERILKTGQTTDLDEKRAQALSLYLAEIHKTRKSAPELYTRRIRELIGHGECIMGLTDNYPSSDPLFTPDFLEWVEKECIRWRWSLKYQGHRLCQVHGDFHPWNILFQQGTDFVLLDRSRGEWGEAADDVSSLSINYLFFSLQKEEILRGPFELLHRTFWNTYLYETEDFQILSLVQPFLVWRSLVLANPRWYPGLEVRIRKKLRRFIENILSLSRFDPDHVNDYLV